MRPTHHLWRAATARTPMIKFIGKRQPPSTPPPAESPATEPHPHPESPSGSLPDSFISYRSKATQHGPLGGHNRKSTLRPSGSTSSPSLSSTSSHAYGAIGGHSGHELGNLKPLKGEVMDRSELPKRFRALAWTAEELEAVEMGGAGVPMGWGGS